MRPRRFLSFVCSSCLLLVLTARTSHAQSSSPASGTGLNKINHIIFLAQENRSFDHYFGALRQYWAQNGYPDQSYYGLPQFNPSSGPLPHYSPPLTNPGCDPNYPPPSTCQEDNNSPKIKSFEVFTQCTENTSPSWNESHNDWDFGDPTGLNRAPWATTPEMI